ncbi:Rrf2 family transcriptional regulator [Paenibacillus ottowii]|uniref:Rrf2 family transcriptional regulator n=1 Tax=Paenibacillus ottowii TaxID=2315729 RepID=A0ABY3B7M1_9BACL|nr:Rrf2 family transcriptional regulator [Paenibacillus ottowii]TQR99503.1 Rrf2 family transcriptional regulator [Paenibacillus ottowii]
MNSEKRLRTATPKWLGIAVKALVYLEKHGELCASGSIARSIDCEVTLVRRVLTRLVQANLIAAREGREGGYVLTRSADHITLADIYHAIEICDPIFPGMMHEPETNPFCEELATAVSEILAESERRMLEVWESYTLASLAKRTSLVLGNCSHTDDQNVKSSSKSD